MQNNIEKATVTFENKESNEEIVINMSYDKESSNIDYSVKMNESAKKNKTLDFIGFLAHMFLESLVNQSKDESKEE